MLVNARACLAPNALRKSSFTWPAAPPPLLNVLVLSMSMRGSHCSSAYLDVRPQVCQIDSSLEQFLRLLPSSLFQGCRWRACMFNSTLRRVSFAGNPSTSSCFHCLYFKYVDMRFPSISEFSLELQLSWAHGRKSTVNKLCRYLIIWLQHYLHTTHLIISLYECWIMEHIRCILRAYRLWLVFICWLERTFTALCCMILVRVQRISHPDLPFAASNFQCSPFTTSWGVLIRC